MSQLLVTSAPVIYIFPLSERKQQKWSLKWADRGKGNTRWWVQGPRKRLVKHRAPSHSQIPPWGNANEVESYDPAYGASFSGVSSDTFAWIKNKKGTSGEPSFQTKVEALQTPRTDDGFWASSTHSTGSTGSGHLGSRASGLHGWALPRNQFPQFLGSWKKDWSSCPGMAFLPSGGRPYNEQSVEDPHLGRGSYSSPWSEALGISLPGVDV